MPDTASGLEIGEQKLDPNSDAGFSALLAQAVAKGSGSESDQVALDEVINRLEQSDTSVLSGLTTEESAPQGQPRDDEGRFVPAAPVAPEVPTQEGEAPPEEGGTDDEQAAAIAAFIERHGGDAQAAVAAALRENEEAQSLIGRQGNELGDLRKAQQEYAERMARVEGRLEATPEQQPVQVTRAELENFVIENGGDAAWRWAADQAPELLGTVASLWDTYDESGRAREVWNNYLQNLALGSRETTAATPEPDPVLQEIRSERQLSDVISSVRETMNEADWEIVSDYLAPVLGDERTPAIVKNAVTSADPQTQRDGIVALVELAKARVIAEATVAAKEEAAVKSKETKQAAQVATGSLRPAEATTAQTDVTKMSKEERHTLFKKAMLAAETTDVNAGLVYGKA